MDTETTANKIWKHVISKGGFFVALVSCLVTVFMWKQARNLHNENVDLNARLSGYTTHIDSGNLVLTGGGVEFLNPDHVEVVPLWSPTSGLPLAELRGTGIPLGSGISDMGNQTITYSNIIDRVCSYPQNKDRCDLVLPDRLLVSIHLLGELRDSDEVPIL